MGHGFAPRVGWDVLCRGAIAPGTDMTNIDLRQNRLLASLPNEEWERWSPLLERIEMPLGSVVYEPGVALTYVYFPITSIVSLLYVMENGASAEIAVVKIGRAHV